MDGEAVPNSCKHAPEALPVGIDRAASEVLLAIRAKLFGHAQTALSEGAPPLKTDSVMVIAPSDPIDKVPGLTRAGADA